MSSRAFRTRGELRKAPQVGTLDFAGPEVLWHPAQAVDQIEIVVGVARREKVGEQLGAGPDLPRHRVIGQLPHALKRHSLLLGDVPAQRRSGQAAKLPGEFGGEDFFEQLVGDRLRPGPVEVVALDGFTPVWRAPPSVGGDVVAAEVDEHGLRAGDGS
jgi:hypothetical protein